MDYDNFDSSIQNHLTSNLPDNKTVDIRNYVLDPLTTIIKLAILSNKPVGTKLYINNNTIFLQEPGIFQSICRYVYNSNKTDLQYLYNPIELACKTYLEKTKLTKFPKLRDLFGSAKSGLKKLRETYKNCSIIVITLNYYDSLISNYLNETFNPNLFYKDSITPLYTDDLLNKMNTLWTDDKIKIVLNLTTFLSGDEYANTNVRSLETIIANIDSQVKGLL